MTEAVQNSVHFEIVDQNTAEAELRMIRVESFHLGKVQSEESKGIPKIPVRVLLSLTTLRRARLNIRRGM